MKKLLCIILLILCLTANVSHSQSFKMFGQLLNLGHWSTDGLVFYWRGIEAGNAVDESYYRNHGTLYGPTWVGDGLDFNGSSDYVTIPGNDLFSFTTGSADLPFTIVARVKLDNVASRMPIISKYQDESPLDGEWVFSFRQTENVFGLQLIGDAPNEWIIGKSNSVGDISGQWATIAVIYDGNASLLGFTFVYNGQDISSGGGISSGVYGYMRNRSAAVELGVQVRNSAFVEWFDGQQFHIIIYNRALSVSEAQQLTINPDLPMQQPPIWLLQPSVVPSGIIPIIQAHVRRRRAG